MKGLPIQYQKPAEATHAFAKYPPVRASWIVWIDPEWKSPGIGWRAQRCKILFRGDKPSSSCLRNYT